MLAVKSRLPFMVSLSFLCFLLFASHVNAQSVSRGTSDLKGTDSAGSFSYGKDSIGKGLSIGHSHKKSEGSKSKRDSHSLHGQSSKREYGHKKSEGSKSKGYSHSPHGKSKHEYSHKKSEGSKSKGYSHSPHGKSKHGYSHKKSEGSKSQGYSHGESGHGKSRHGSKMGYGKSHGYKRSISHGGHDKSPFRHVLSFKKKLGLTDTQVQKAKKFEFEYKKKRIQANADHKIAHMELDMHVHSGKVDEAKIRSVGEKLVAAKAMKIMAMVEAKLQLLNLLTEEQRQKMVKMHH